MSPRYTPDPTKASFGFTVFPKGTYRLEIGEPKSFANFVDAAKTTVKNYGVRINGKVIVSSDHPELVGKNMPISLYLHTEGAAGYTKGVEAAILGCKTDEEFNQLYGSDDFSFNTDDQSVGEFYHKLKGKIVDVDCDDPQVPENSTTGNLQTVVARYRIAE